MQDRVQMASELPQEEVALVLMENRGKVRKPQTTRTMPTVSFKERVGVPDVTDKKGRLWKALVAEFLGNLLLNFFGCATCLNVGDPSSPADIVRIGLGFGLAILAGVQSFCHVSGAHLNPAVTIACLLTGKVSFLRALFYVIIQCLGSATGSGILKALTPHNHEIQGNLGLTLVNPSLSAVQGFGVEFFLGFVLVMVVFGVCDSNRPLVFIPAPLAIGLTVTLGHMAAVPMTGSSMNPARTFGSAVVVNIWTDHWVYWIGPILGGAVAACIYQTLFVAPPPESSDYTPVRVDDRGFSSGKSKDEKDRP